MIQKEYDINSLEVKSIEDIDNVYDEYGTRSVVKYLPDGTTVKEYYYILQQNNLPEGAAYYKLFPSKKPNKLIFRDAINHTTCSAFVSRNPDMAIDSYYLQVMHLENYEKLPAKIQNHFQQLKNDELDNYTGFYLKYDLEFNPVKLYYWIEKPYIVDFLETLSAYLGFNTYDKLTEVEDVSVVKYIIFAEKDEYNSLYVSHKREWV